MVVVVENYAQLSRKYTANAALCQVASLILGRFLIEIIQMSIVAWSRQLSGLGWESERDAVCL